MDATKGVDSNPCDVRKAVAEMAKKGAEKATLKDIE